jgi:hypothetical protein
MNLSNQGCPRCAELKRAAAPSAALLEKLHYSYPTCTLHANMCWTAACAASQRGAADSLAGKHPDTCACFWPEVRC